MTFGIRSLGLVALAAATFGAAQSQAAVILVSKTQPVATTADDRNLIVTGPSGTLTGTALSLGEVTSDGTFTKPYIPFLLTAGDVADILTNGATATLGFTGQVQNLSGQTFSVLGFPNRGSSTTPNAGATDFNGGTAIPSATGLSFIPGVAQNRYTVDVTSFVLAQAQAGNTAMIFRMELSGQNATVANGQLNGMTINSGDNTANVPTLTIAVPEPVSLAGLGLAATFLRRRRRAIAK